MQRRLQLASCKRMNAGGDKRLAALSSASPKKERSLLMSFVICASIVAACIGCGYLAVLVLTPPFSRLMVYRHYPSTPGESCGDDFNTGPNPYADNFSYWTDNNLTVDLCLQLSYAS